MWMMNEKGNGIHTEYRRASYAARAIALESAITASVGIEQASANLVCTTTGQAPRNRQASIKHWQWHAGSFAFWIRRILDP
jgi:hypothetical protein